MFHCSLEKSGVRHFIALSVGAYKVLLHASLGRGTINHPVHRHYYFTLSAPPTTLQEMLSWRPGAKGMCPHWAKQTTANARASNIQTKRFWGTVAGRSSREIETEAMGCVSLAVRHISFKSGLTLIWKLTLVSYPPTQFGLGKRRNTGFCVPRK